MRHKKETTQLHFVGIGGIGMSGIAQVFLNRGYVVTGSDLVESETTRRLKELGAQIKIGHRSENVEHASVIVISSAVRPNNPELIAARRLRIPIIPRAEMLGELMRGKTGLAVAGSHGKTTTTSMLATILTVAELDPTLVIGGKVDSLGGNAKHGEGEYVVAEADESDGSFLHLPATYSIVTNIDNDHLDHFGSLAAVEDAFVDFVGKLPFYGLAVVCGEDDGIRRTLSRFTKPCVTYGLSKECDYYATEIKSRGMGSSFAVFARDSVAEPHHALGRFTLNVPGEHNVLNALAALTLAHRLGVDTKVIETALSGFQGVKRRFDVRWKDIARRRLIVDDYGHHPSEIQATLAAAQKFWEGRIITVFQPHRFSRTIHCRDGFRSAFQGSDVVLISDIYAAGEDPIEGVNAETLAEDIRRAALPAQIVSYSGSLEQTKDAVLKHFQDGDLVLCLGAGSITRLPDELMRALGAAVSA